MMRGATAVPFEPRGVEPLRPRFRRTECFLGGEAPSLALASTLVNELDRFIWRKRINLGEVAAILRRLLAQGFHPSGNRARAPVPENTLVQRHVLPRLPGSDLADDLARLRGFRACFDDRGHVAGFVLGD